MQGGRTRDLASLRATIAIACVAVTALIAAPVALAGSPAGDQYGSAIPGAGNGNGNSSTSGSGSGSGSGAGTETVIPVAGDSSSSGQGSGGSTDSGGAGGGSAKGGSAHGGDKAGTGANGGTGDATGAGTAPSVTSDNSSHSVPQIAADSAGDSWVPFFIAAMVALACAAGVLIYRNRRRTAQG